ncbi:MAG: GNAT family N-acetyltransferase [Gemmatimonadales bacterium]
MTTATKVSISIAGRVVEARTVATLVEAFQDDPVCRWAWPGNYQTGFAEFVPIFGGNAFDLGTAHIAGDFAGAALWLPPGVGPEEEALVGLIQRTADPSIQPDLFQMLEQMGRFHPVEPHWYLPLIGVVPAEQGKGLGGALMSYALAQCDGDGLPAYLESTNPRNISLYRRHGFEVMGEIRAGSSPVMVPMIRPAKRR